MKKSICFAFILIMSTFLWADNKALYLELLDKKDYTALEKHLTEWAQSSAQNKAMEAELYIAYFNFYLNRGIATKSQEDFFKASQYIDEGIKEYPNRLDMRFGKINTLNMFTQYKDGADAFIETLRHGAKIKQNWYWADNKKYLGKIEEFFLNASYDYYQQWLHAQTDESFAAIERSSLVQIELFPHDPRAYVLYSIVARERGAYKEALKVLKKAEKRFPKDPIIVINIADGYKRMGDAKNAKKQYKKVIEMSEASKELKESATQELQGLEHFYDNKRSY